MRIAHTCAWLAAFMLIAMPLLAQNGKAKDDCGESRVETADIYSAAQLVPDDVDIFVCITNAGPTLKALMNSEVGPGLRAFYERSNGGRSWRKMSDELNLPPDEFFRLLADRRLILVTSLDTPGRSPKDESKRTDNDERKWRGRSDDRKRDSGAVRDRNDKTELPPEDAAISWVALSATDTDDFRKLITGLDCQVVRWVDRIPVYQIKRRSNLEIAYLDEMMVLGTTANRELLDRVLTQGFERALADRPEFREAMQIDPGQVAVFVREPTVEKADDAEPKTANWQGLTVSISPRGTRVEILADEPARQDDFPFSDIRKFQSTIDLSILENVNEGALAVFVEEFTARPDAVGTMSMIAPFVERQPTVTQYVGPTAFTVISSREPRHRHVSERNDEVAGLKIALSPQPQRIAIAWGVELKQPRDKATRMMDQLLVSALRALQVCIDQPDALKIPDLEQLEPGEMRWVDLTPCSETLLDAVPGLDEMMLHWTTVTADAGAWWVCATDIGLLNETTAALQRRPRLSAERDEIAMGVIDGPAAATLLESWQEVNPRTDDPVYSRLFYLEEILKATPRIHWVVRRKPDESHTHTTIKIDWGF